MSRYAQPCTCGSKLPRFSLYDNANIFLRYVCDKCVAEKKAGYNPNIFVNGPYAASGSESDLEAMDYMHEDDGETAAFESDPIPVEAPFLTPFHRVWGGERFIGVGYPMSEFYTGADEVVWITEQWPFDGRPVQRRFWL